MLLLRVLTFFPSINFGLIRAEIFPWATLYALLTFRSLNVRLLCIVALLIVSLAIAALDTNFIYFSEQFRSLAAYINPILVFFAILSARSIEVRRLVLLIDRILIFLLILGFLQLFGFLFFLENFIVSMIPRGSAESLQNIGRGVTLLSTEPSRAGYELLFVYAAWRCLSHRGFRFHMMLDAFIFVYLLTVIQSALSIYLAILYFFVLYINHYRVSIVVAIIFLISIYLADTRASSLLIGLLDHDDFVGVYRFLINASGFRLASIVSSYQYSIESIFGGGVGLWQISSIVALRDAGFQANDISYFMFRGEGDLFSIRPTSYAANLALDTGIVGLVVFLVLMGKYFFDLRRFADHDSNAFIVLFLFSFFFIGSVGNPVPWALFAILLRRLGGQSIPQSFEISGRADNLSSSKKSYSMV